MKARVSLEYSFLTQLIYGPCIGIFTGFKSDIGQLRSLFPYAASATATRVGPVLLEWAIIVLNLST